MLIAGIVVAGTTMHEAGLIDITHLPALFCVADGIGGAAHGEVASRMVLEFFAQYSPLPKTPDNVPVMIHEAKAVLDLVAIHEPGFTGFGTTVAGLLLSLKEAIVFNCGDSRVYRIDKGKIDQISHDHSLVQELCDHGEISVEQMYTHPLRNIITASVSGDPHRPLPRVMTTSVSLTGSELFLLCTDGVWGVLGSDDMVAICTGGDLQQAAQKMVQACLDGGGPDNISIILVKPGR